MITQSELKSQLHYDHETGLFTRLKINNRKYRIGELAGTINAYGYIDIKLNNITYKAHRLAWFYMTGAWPKQFIDHINMIRNDNAFNNLREATRNQNVYNRNKLITNTSGHKNVNWCKRTNKLVARGAFEKNRRHLGYFIDISKAMEAADNYSLLKHGEFSRTT